MRKLVSLFFILSFSLAFVACIPNDKEATQRKKSIEERVETLAKAEKVIPVPSLENFPIREALVEYTKRQDMVNHPWYTYLLGDNGNYIGYYVTRTGPISTCNFLGSTEIVDSTQNGKVVLTAPSLDGIFYGGSGASATCGFFFFDYTTNALAVISPGQKFLTFDAPLALEVKPIPIQAR